MAPTLTDVNLWRISRHDDLDGLGGERADGRWHTAAKGKRIVYLSEHPALALIEVLANLKGNPRLFPDAYRLMKISVHPKVWSPSPKPGATTSPSPAPSATPGSPPAPPPSSASPRPPPPNPSTTSSTPTTPTPKPSSPTGPSGSPTTNASSTSTTNPANTSLPALHSFDLFSTTARPRKLTLWPL